MERQEFKLFNKRKEKQVNAIKKFDALLTAAMVASDLIPEIKQILESHYKQFQKTQDVECDAQGFVMRLPLTR